MKIFKLLSFLVFSVFLSGSAAHAWDIDFSRRQKKGDSPQQPAPTEDTSLPSEPIPTDPNAPADPVPVANSSSSATQTRVNTAIPVTTEMVQNPQVITQQADSGDDVVVRPGHRLDSFVKHTVTPVVYDRQEFVILNTDKGFVPSNVRLRKGFHYVVHVVNVNEDRKNVSFMLDAFKQHHATYYGKIKTFNLDPDREGIFEFQCPETDFHGKFVIFGNTPGTSPGAPDRVISSEK